MVSSAVGKVTWVGPIGGFYILVLGDRAANGRETALESVSRVNFR